MLRKILIFNIVVLLLSVSIHSTKAQTRDYPWSFGLHGGLLEYKGDLGNGFFKFDLTKHAINYSFIDQSYQHNDPGVAGISISKYQNPNFDCEFRWFHGEHGYHINTFNQFYRRTDYVDLTAHWKFLANDKASYTPYLIFGFGMRVYPASAMLEQLTGSKNRINILFPLGAGVKIPMTDRANLVLNSNFAWTGGDDVDGQIGGGRDLVWLHTIGISFNIGGKKDNDGDKVSDAWDKCPNTPKGALVDKNGCILDKDKDGIADNLDECPDMAGLAKFNGCPDSDNDGIQDSEDKCIYIPGLAKFQGCPDTDEDGIQDSEDKCPNVKGLAIYAGCPDTDGDSIPDNIDKCPKSFGTSKNNGCPEIKASEKKIMAEALAGVMFESNSAKIRMVSFPKLANVLKVLKNNPSYNLSLEGYTDNVGDPEKNLALSKDRAAAVKQYLINNGIVESRISSEGFGEANPIADNATQKGRLVNRRVEFKIMFD